MRAFWKTTAAKTGRRRAAGAFRCPLPLRRSTARCAFSSISSRRGRGRKRAPPRNLRWSAAFRRNCLPLPKRTSMPILSPRFPPCARIWRTAIIPHAPPSPGTTGIPTGQTNSCSARKRGRTVRSSAQRAQGIRSRLIRATRLTRSTGKLPSISIRSPTIFLPRFRRRWRRRKRRRTTPRRPKRRRRDMQTRRRAAPGMRQALRNRRQVRRRLRGNRRVRRQAAQRRRRRAQVLLQGARSPRRIRQNWRRGIWSRRRTMRRKSTGSMKDLTIFPSPATARSFILFRGPAVRKTTDTPNISGSAARSGTSTSVR